MGGQHADVVQGHRKHCPSHPRTGRDRKESRGLQSQHTHNQKRIGHSGRRSETTQHKLPESSEGNRNSQNQAGTRRKSSIRCEQLDWQVDRGADKVGCTGRGVESHSARVALEVDCGSRVFDIPGSCWGENQDKLN